MSKVATSILVVLCIVAAPAAYELGRADGKRAANADCDYRIDKLNAVWTWAWNLPPYKPVSR